jgi:hypothetical protein
LFAGTCIYGLASFVHFAHNAAFAADYPNLPGWITPSIVIATWLSISCIALLAWLALRAGARGLGLCLLAVYAMFGFDAFAHYGLAPLDAHSFAMNATICFEGASACALFVVTLVHATNALAQKLLE